MKSLRLIPIFLVCSINLLAQPVDQPFSFDPAAFHKPFLQCVKSEKYFAKYAGEAHSDQFIPTDTLLCQMHLPLGFNRLWREMEAGSRYEKGEFDYSNDSIVHIQFDFYLFGKKISTSFDRLKKEPEGDEYFTYFFKLNPNDTDYSPGDLNYAYKQLLDSIRKPQAQVGIQVSISSKKMEKINSIPLAYSSFFVFQHPKESKVIKEESVEDQVPGYVEKDSQLSDYNPYLRHLADSVMISHFGQKGFEQNFVMTCLQNPCKKGQLYDNTFKTENPCATEPQDTCKEAIVTYGYVKSGVPLTIKILIAAQHNGVYAYLENNRFGREEISLEKQNLLSIDEINAKINHQFGNGKLSLISRDNVLSFYIRRMEDSQSKNKSKSISGKVIKETKAGKNCESGFIYTAYSLEPKKKRTYYFSAVTGKLLWIMDFPKARVLPSTSVGPTE